MKVRRVVMVTLFFCLALRAQISEEQHARSAEVKSSGCLEPGVEAGCKILRDSKTGVLYNLFFHSKDRPETGTGISIEGTTHDGPTTCMQGKAVDVTKWKKAEMQCPSSTQKDVRPQ
jgi:hypothetical protein